MTRIIPVARRMTPQEFEAELRRRCAPGFDHMMVVTDHAAERMTERGITRTMVLRIIRRGSVDGTRLSWDDAHGNWMAPVIGITAGVELDVRCALRSTGETVIVVTAINKGSAG